LERDNNNDRGELAELETASGRKAVAPETMIVKN
jgi:hypothetical protein